MASQALADTSAIVITGAEQSDRLTIDFSNPFSIPIAFSDTSAEDSDSLEVVGTENIWDITENDKGRIRGGTVVDFEAIENLLGGSDTDTFIFWGGSKLKGLLKGGGGSDKLVGADTANVWNVTDSDSGRLNEQAFDRD